MTSYATSVAAARPGRGQDRVAAVEICGRLLVVVADGAGGVSGGAEAADYVVAAVLERRRAGEVSDWAAVLGDVDRAMAARGTRGLAAAVVLEVLGDGRVFGASVGDCEAHVFGPSNFCLTHRQVRKPLLGDGSATPVGFAYSFGAGTLVAATDGLWKHAVASWSPLAAIQRPLEVAAAGLIDLLTLPSGELRDDVAVAVCEVVS